MMSLALPLSTASASKRMQMDTKSRCVMLCAEVGSVASVS